MRAIQTAYPGLGGPEAFVTRGLFESKCKYWGQKSNQVSRLKMHDRMPRVY
jgi:hypothetical protein